MSDTTIIFDFFGVICSEIAPYWLDRYFSPEKASEIKSTIVRLADFGKISQTEMFCKLGEQAGVSAKSVEDDWNDLVSIDQNLVEYIDVIRDNFYVALLTNSPSDFVRGILKKFDLERLFSCVVVSSEIGSAKPDAQAFEYILKKLSVNPAKTIMIDDNPINIQGANLVGMNALLFTNLDVLKINLSKKIAII